MENLLVLHLSGALRAHPLHGQIEDAALILRNVVEVDAGPQKFPGAGPQRLQRERLLAGLQGQASPTRAVDHAHDERLAPAVVEELLDGVAQQAGLPQAAENLLKFRETLDEDRTIDRSAQCAADEGGARRGQTRDGMIGAAFFGDL